MLARHCQWCHNYDDAVKYYLMAIEHGNTSAMNFLASYYYRLANYEGAIIFWLCAVSHDNYDNINALLNMCEHKDFIEYGITCIYSILNKDMDDKIVDYIIKCIGNMNADMINIIVNMESSSDTSFNSIKSVACL